MGQHSERNEAGLSPEEAVAKLEAIYSSSKSALQTAFDDFVENGRTPLIEDRESGRFSYPRLTVKYEPEGPLPALSRAFGKFNGPGSYQTDIAQPSLFREL